MLVTNLRAPADAWTRRQRTRRFSLAKAALAGAQQALDAAKMAETAAVKAAGLAMVALNAVGMAYEHVEEARGLTPSMHDSGPTWKG